MVINSIIINHKVKNIGTKKISVKTKTPSTLRIFTAADSRLVVVVDKLKLSIFI